MGFRCYPPVLGGTSYELLPVGCNPKTQGCTVRATVPTDFPGNSQSLQAAGGGAHVDWLSSANVNVGTCGRIGSEIVGDKGNAWIEVGGFSCAGSAAGADTYTIQAQVCTSGCSNIPIDQRRTSSTVDLTVPGLQALFCKRPPTYGCPGDGPAGTCCLGPAGGSSPAGGGAGTGGEGAGPGAHLFYLAGGAGNPEWPGAAPWSLILGRGWSHSYAERIILDPDDTHVWLITRHATYREFSGLSVGVYTQVQPRDEYRKLVRTGTGWELRGLDGTIEVFDAGGLWSRTTDRNGNATLGTYTAGRLAGSHHHLAIGHPGIPRLPYAHRCTLDLRRQRPALHHPLLQRRRRPDDSHHPGRRIRRQLQLRDHDDLQRGRPAADDRSSWPQHSGRDGLHLRSHPGQPSAPDPH